MLILADENIEHALLEALRAHFNVYSIYFENRGLSDLEISEIAKEQHCLLITEDKDFGDLVFTKGHTHLSVVLLRYSFKERGEMIKVLVELLLNQSNNLMGKFTSVTVQKIRIREL